MNLVRFILAKGLNRTSIEIVLDLIYAASDLLFPAEKIIFGQPVEIDIHQDIENDVNTFVPVNIDSEYDDRFTGPKKDNFHYQNDRIDGFLYRRIPLTLLTPDSRVTFERPQVYPFKIHDVLDDINVKLNSKLTIDDVINDVYDSPTEHITMRASPHSLAWIDELVLFFDALGGRILEDGSLRITEDSRVRDLESGFELTP